MTMNEVIKGVIAILVVAGAITSAFINVEASNILIPIASFVVGYYFKDGQDIAIGKIKELFKK